MKQRILSLLALVLIGTGMARADAGFRVDRFTSNLAWNANSWILESETGLVLIDAQMLRGDAARLAAMLKAYGKPLAGVIITHPHPDHFLGLAELKRRLGDFPILGGTDTGAQMEAARAQFLAWARDVYGDDVEDEGVPLTRTIDADTRVELAGIPLFLDRFGAGEAGDHLVVYQPDRKLLFTGDVVMAGSHHYVGEGRSAQLLAQLKAIRTDYAEAARLFPGHGDPVRLAAVDDGIGYVETARAVFEDLAAQAVNRHESGRRLTDDARKAFIDRMAAAYPGLGDFGLPPREMLALNLGGLERELLGTEAAAAP